MADQTSPQPIYEVRVRLAGDRPEETAAVFHLCCPDGFVLDDPPRVPAREVRPYSIVCYIEGEGRLPYFLDSLERTASRLLREGRIAEPARMEWREIPREDWRLSWRNHFKTLHPAPGVSVRPPWEPPVEAPGHADLVVNPGAGFGVGSHATTALALEALGGMELKGKSFLDVGCGSGVLALYARRLGAFPCVGIDFDAEAVANALDNLNLNPASAGTRFETADIAAFDPGSGYDRVAANLTEGLILENLGALRRACSPGGQIFFTGILAMSLERMAIAFEKYFVVLDTKQKEEWCGFLTTPRED